MIIQSKSTQQRPPGPLAVLQLNDPLPTDKVLHISHGITNLHHYVKAAYTWLFAFAWEQTNALVKKTLGGCAFTFNNIV